MKPVWEAAKQAFASPWLLCVLLAVSPLEPAAADSGAASLVIHVANVDARGGMLRLGLYDAAGYPDDNAEPVAAADVRAEPGETVVVLRGLKPGTYAIQAYQDINTNNKMDVTWFGYPKEPFGFSRDARPHFRKPRFGQVEFVLKPGENSQTLHLQHSVSLLAAE
jgi:uncharacterized protein (DUF2141 family)